MKDPTLPRALPGLLTLLTLLPACAPDAPLPLEGTGPELERAALVAPGVYRQYGTPTRLGDGMVRTYVVLDARADHSPLELGVALDARALEGLPADGAVQLLLDLPQRSPMPYEFVMFDWNPHGHHPENVYTLPHFDFHFYLTPREEVEAIDPRDADFAAKANRLPTGDHVPPFYAVLMPPGAQPASVAVPRMGVHWVDVRSPELQRMLGNPDAYRPFTRTFIYGSWDGRLTFLEPMITRDHLRAQSDVTVPISRPARFPEPGWYPSAYRIVHDARAREYRVGLTGLSWSD